MKNSILVAFSMIILAAMGAQAGHHEGAKEERQVIGMGLSMDGEFKPLYAGSSSNMKIWQDWIQAHNDRDFDKIAEINGDDFNVISRTVRELLVRPPTGSYWRVG